MKYKESKMKNIISRLFYLICSELVRLKKAIINDANLVFSVFEISELKKVENFGFLGIYTFFFVKEI